MKTRTARLRYYVVDAVDAWRHRPWPHLLATATLAATLFAASVVLVVLGNVDRRLDDLRNDVRIDVYAADGIALDALRALGAELERRPEVERVAIVDPEQALARLRAWFDEADRAIAAIGENPLPATIEVHVYGHADPVATASRLREAFGSDPRVDEIAFDREWLARTAAVVEAARAVAFAVGAFVGVAAVFVMASVLRLAVYARREEVEIVLLVGATPGFARGPFLFSGVAQGVIGAVAALSAAELARVGFLAYCDQTGVRLPAIAAAEPLAWTTWVAVVAVGAVVGLVGSYLAVRGETAHYADTPAAELRSPQKSYRM